MMSSVHVFFFSSRRRHTRFDCDWSSDVCSSDLVAASAPADGHECVAGTVIASMSGADALGLMTVIVFAPAASVSRSEEHTSELQSQSNLVCRLLLEKKKKYIKCSLRTAH